MSTNYYPFLCGISSVRLEQGPGHDRVAVWQRGGKCGELVVDLGTGLAIAKLFCSDTPILHAYYGGTGVGLVIERSPASAGLPLPRYVLSENGELFETNALKETERP